MSLTNWIELNTTESNIPLPDIQKTKPIFPVYIDRVGIKNLKIPIYINIKDKEDYQSTVADISAYVDLPKSEKGTHMSRLSIAIQKFSNEKLNQNTLKNICKEIKESCQSDTSQVIYDFPYFLTKTSPISNLLGINHYYVIFDMTLNKNNEFIFSITVKSIATSVCPCSKEISEAGAHNQRSNIVINAQVDLNSNLLWIEDLIEVAESSASERVYSVLKREDEKYVTEKGYENPLFVEDIVRNCYKKLINFNNINKFKIYIENEESIHLHNAYASISWIKENYEHDRGIF